jgi:hypothetical protein
MLSKLASAFRRWANRRNRKICFAISRVPLINGATHFMAKLITFARTPRGTSGLRRDSPRFGLGARTAGKGEKTCKDRPLRLWSSISGFCSPPLAVHISVSPSPASRVSAAGSSVECPKRTGYNKPLFAGISENSDACSDPDCYSAEPLTANLPKAVRFFHVISTSKSVRTAPALERVLACQCRNSVDSCRDLDSALRMLPIILRLHTKRASIQQDREVVRLFRFWHCECNSTVKCY